MHTYQEALKAILDISLPGFPKLVPIIDALKLVLAQDVIASEPIPFFNNSAMDGFAIRALDCQFASYNSPIQIPILDTIKAGQTVVPILVDKSAYRIMTGAVMPTHADTVIPIEKAFIKNNNLEIYKALECGANVRLKGEDIKAGEIIIAKNTVLKPAEIGILASIGCSKVLIYPRPKVAIITTGDELVSISSKLEVGRIRDANIYLLSAQAESVGATVLPFARVNDEYSVLLKTLKVAISDADVIIINGGVSVGDFDYTKKLLENIGAKKIFWGVAQKPGAPFGVWTIDKKIIFGIPGNPVAAMIVFEEYVRPALRRIMGFQFLHRPERQCTIESVWHRRISDARLNFILATTRVYNQRIYLKPTSVKGSGILSSTMNIDAIAIAMPDCTQLNVGDYISAHFIHELEDH